MFQSTSALTFFSTFVWVHDLTPERRGEGERMSIALNVMFSGSIGEPRWTGPHGAEL